MPADPWQRQVHSERDRPAESDVEVLRIGDPTVVSPADDANYHFAVQEPFEDVEEGQFFIATPKSPRGFEVGYQDGVRLGGVYRDASGDLQYQWADMQVLAAADLYYNAGIQYSSSPDVYYYPATPDQNWEITTASSKFDSGVICRDSSSGGGALKIFAGHNVVATNQSEDPILPVDRTEFRWYVIDPDLANFPSTSWDPQIEVVGVAPLNGVTDAETHQGAIAVNEEGVAYITFTRTGTANNGWPSLVRAPLEQLQHHAVRTVRPGRPAADVRRHQRRTAGHTWPRLRRHPG